MTSEIWVGQLERKTLVFDPSVQLVGCPHVFLWNFTSKEMEKFIASVSRTLIRKAIDRALTERALLEYEEWRRKYSVAWLADEQVYYDERLANERIAAKGIQELHRQRLELLGLPYDGVRGVLPTRERRKTHCYACKANLDNSVQLECAVCDWILCQCGACGCGFSR